MTILLVIALVACMVTGVSLARATRGEGGSSVRVHAICAAALVVCAVLHAVSNLLG